MTHLNAVILSGRTISLTYATITCLCTVNERKPVFSTWYDRKALRYKSEGRCFETRRGE
jgi:hypothetical protein